MSDGAWSSIPVIIAAVTLAIIQIGTWWRAEHRAAKIVERVDAVDVKVDAVKKQTDGLTSALVKSEKIVSKAEGVAEGKAIEKAANGGDKH